MLKLSDIKLASRLDIPDLLNRNGLVGTAVEVGVHVGSFAHHFCSAWQGERYIGVDPYKVYPGSDIDQATQDEYFEHAKRALAGFGSKAVLRRATGLEFAADTATLKKVAFTGLGFDFVYLDGDHSYESVIAEIKAFLPLVKPGGIIAGHDAIADGWHPDNNPTDAYATKEESLKYGPSHEFGVLKAINEVFGTNGYVLTDEGGPDYGYRSWLYVVPG